MIHIAIALCTIMVLWYAAKIVFLIVGWLFWTTLKVDPLALRQIDAPVAMGGGR